jgi:hypothetical protein
MAATAASLPISANVGATAVRSRSDDRLPDVDDRGRDVVVLGGRAVHPEELAERAFLAAGPLSSTARAATVYLTRHT